MFLATSSSTVGRFVSCAKIAGMLSAAAPRREIIKRRCIGSFGNRYETAQCHGYSNEVETQALLQAKIASAASGKANFRVQNYRGRLKSSRREKFRSWHGLRETAILLLTNSTIQLPRQNRVFLLSAACCPVRGN